MQRIFGALAGDYVPVSLMQQLLGNLAHQRVIFDIQNFHVEQPAGRKPSSLLVNFFDDPETRLALLIESQMNQRVFALDQPGYR